MGGTHSVDAAACPGNKPQQRRSVISAKRRSRITSRWQSRQISKQIFCVVRHAERADGVIDFYQGGRWTQTEDFERWPIDPPLSDAGAETAERLASSIQGFAADSESSIHVVVTSPYMRCVETAVTICRHLGPEVRLIVDMSLGEIFGPDTMGVYMPLQPVRSQQDVKDLCKSNGVRCLSRAIGRWPMWPEDLRAARQRFGDRFLTYLERGAVTRRNFVMVTHADAVGTAACLMPSLADRDVFQVDFGGGIYARRGLPAREKKRGTTQPLLGLSPTSLKRKGRCKVAQNGAGDLAVPADPSSARGRKPQEDLQLPLQCICDDVSNGGSMWSELVVSGMLSPSARRDAAIPRASVGMPFSPCSPATGRRKDRCRTPRLRGVSSGWEVRTENIELEKKFGRHHSAGSGRRGGATPTLVRNSRFTRTQIETLLGEMPSRQLTDRFNEDANPAAPQSPSSPCPSVSTILFGASEAATPIDQLSPTDAAFSLAMSLQHEVDTVARAFSLAVSLQHEVDIIVEDNGCADAGVSIIPQRADAAADPERPEQPFLREGAGSLGQSAPVALASLDGANEVVLVREPAMKVVSLESCSSALLLRRRHSKELARRGSSSSNEAVPPLAEATPP